MPRDLLKLDGPWVGLNTKDDPTKLLVGESPDCINVVLDENTVRERRKLYEHLEVFSDNQFTDSFGRADSGTLGANWTESETNGTLAIVSEQVDCAFTGSGDCLAIYGTAVSANQHIQLDVSGIFACKAGIVFGYTDANNYNECVLFNDGTYKLRVYKTVSSSRSAVKTVNLAGVSDIDSGPYNIGVSWVNNKLVCSLARESGGRLTIMAFSDSTLATGTKCGFIAADGVDTATASFDNFTVTPESDCARGLVEYEDSSSRSLVTKFGGTLYSNSTSISTGLTAGTLFDSFVANNLLYILDGTSGGKYFDGSSLVGIKIAAPSAKLTHSAGSGALTGDYDWKYTYYDSSTGIESASSPVSDTLTLSGQGADLTMVLSGDSRVDKHRIYRRRTDRYDTVWRLVAEIAESTSYTDAALDSDVNDGDIAPVSSTSSIPAFKYGEWFLGRAFYATGTDSKLYFSELGRPGTVMDESENWIYVGGDDDTDPITGLGSVNGVLVIFKKRSVYRLTGNSPDNFVLDPITHETGCVGHGSIVAVDNQLYFAGHTMFYRTDGFSVQHVSYRIEPTWRRRVMLMDNLIVGVHDPAQGAVLWSYYGEGAVNNDSILVHFYRHSQTVGRESWVPWKFELPVTALSTAEDSENAVQLYMAQSDGSVRLYRTDDFIEPFNDALSESVPPDCYWVTGKIAASYPDRMKHWHELGIDLSGACSMRYILDGGTEVTHGNSGSADGRARISRRSRHIQIKLVFGAYDDKYFRSISLWHWVLGGRAR